MQSGYGFAIVHGTLTAAPAGFVEMVTKAIGARVAAVAATTMAVRPAIERRRDPFDLRYPIPAPLSRRDTRRSRQLG
jgi:hypothetical protein